MDTELDGFYRCGASVEVITRSRGWESRACGCIYHETELQVDGDRKLAPCGHNPEDWGLGEIRHADQLARLCRPQDVHRWRTTLYTSLQARTRECLERIATETEVWGPIYPIRSAGGAALRALQIAESPAGAMALLIALARELLNRLPEGSTRREEAA